MVILLALAATTAQAAEPSATQLALYKALSGRHQEQTCTEVARLSPEPATDLVWLAEHAEQPAWVSVRAAECVLDLYPEPAGPSIARWMASEDTLGLALTAVARLDSLPVAQAKPILAAGLAGPHADRVRVRAEKLQQPELRALVIAP